MPAVPGFLPSRNGFDFPNWFPAGTPILELATPFGVVPVGDAHGGVCGGMIFACIDFFAEGRIPPLEATPELVAYFGRRLLDSWNLPFGVLRYFDMMRRPGECTHWSGVRVRPGIYAETADLEWPKVKAELDAGRLAALGLVMAHSADPRNLGRNHQVLAYAYDEPAAGEIAVRVYDPNYPNDDAATLTFSTAKRGPVRHACEGETVRGFFLTEYRRPAVVPEFD